MAIQREEQPEEHLINLKNVFEIARKIEGGINSSDEESENEEGEEEEEPV